MANKRGQLGNLQGIVLTLVIVGILIGAGFLILEQLRDQDSLSDNLVSTEDLLVEINNTGFTLTGASDVAFNSPSITSVVFNNGTTVASTQYSVNANGVLRNATTQTYTDVNVSYTYNRGENGYVAVNDSIEAMTTVPDLLGLIVLIVIIGIILAVIFNVIPTGRVSGA